VASPLKLSATPPQTHTPPPTIGQHSRAILREVLGKTDDEIETLMQAGAIGEDH